MDTFFQEMLGGVGRLQENVRVTLFLNDTEKKHREIINWMQLQTLEVVTWYLLKEQ